MLDYHLTSLGMRALEVKSAWKHARLDESMQVTGRHERRMETLKTKIAVLRRHLNERHLHHDNQAEENEGLEVLTGTFLGSCFNTVRRNERVPTMI